MRLRRWPEATAVIATYGYTLSPIGTRVSAGEARRCLGLYVVDDTTDAVRTLVERDANRRAKAYAVAYNRTVLPDFDNAKPCG